jgi:phenylpropionate dioxygenase-like ring-hydroxylating dioxygenase large terminal subunit
MRTTLSMRPTGWFQVGWSSTIPPVGAVPLHYFGQDLVAWRDRHGVPHVLDAYCQHLGGNLAYGSVRPAPPVTRRPAAPDNALAICHRSRMA